MVRDLQTLLAALDTARHERDALQAELEARTAEKQSAVDWLKQLTVAATDDNFDSRNWASDWRERWREQQQKGGDHE